MVSSKSERAAVDAARRACAAHVCIRPADKRPRLVSAFSGGHPATSFIEIAGRKPGQVVGGLSLISTGRNRLAKLCLP